ncbi:hypothetical protein QR680_012337 [Steinernema hermaphroditum]|uniref:FMRFamide-like peptide 14 n=1 Tax=Steinernema hermaphroditum TaxID=289476 RepID=A0AA39I1S0_9BILA|nr:hypothetical protein QR680_012337 [Steinernema hermaphroditum]
MVPTSQQFGVLLAGIAATLLVAATHGADAAVAPPQTTTQCAQILANPDEYSEKTLLCQLYESSNLLAELGVLVSEGVEKLMATQGLSTENEEQATGSGIEKRKHEYLRFGKRKHEYLRFGKRKHEYLRFGRK